MLDRRLHLRAVEPDRAVHTAVADEDDVMVASEATRGLEVHVRPARTTFESEDRSTRVRSACADPRHRQRDQARVRLVTVLAHDERAAIGAIAAVLGRVAAGVQHELAGVRARRHGDRVGAAEVEVREAECREGDERESGDSRWAERLGSRGFHRFPFVESVARR